MIAEFDDVYYMMFAEYLTGKPLSQLMNLKYKDFIKWLAKVQLVDEDMVVIVDMITIKK